MNVQNIRRLENMKRTFIAVIYDVHLKVLRKHKSLQQKLEELEMFCRSEGNSTEELQGESQALKFVLNISHQQV